MRLLIVALLLAPLMPLYSQAAPPIAVTTSEYLTTRDGTSLAVDIHLPAGRTAGERLPVLIELTRYWRASEHAVTGARLSSLGALNRRFLREGYAVVIVDTRGSGASFGTRTAEFSPQEVRDGYDVVSWVARQPWSNGKVGAYGTSYSGTTAELLAAAGHPALKAVIPGWSDFDVYTSPVRPYGMLTAFVEEWGHLVGAMDRNDRVVMRAAVRRVDADTAGTLVAAAVLEHANNPDVTLWARTGEYRDDRVRDGPSYADLGPVRWRAEIQRSKVPMLVLVSWLDAGTAAGALERFRSFRNPQKLVIMASSHGGNAHASPFTVTSAQIPNNPNTTGLADLRVQFFDRHLKGTKNGVDQWPAIRYYTLGSETFADSPVWPLASTTTTRLFLAPDGGLTRSRPNSTGTDRYVVDFGVSTGPANRWATQLGRPVLNLHDRGAMDTRMLTYTTAPLERDMHIAGSPIVDLQLSSTHPDGALLVYLEDVDESGQSRYLTEGGLRLIHRKLSRAGSFAMAPHHTFTRADAAPMKPGEAVRVTFRVLPTSVVVKAGHRLRLAIAGADEAAFARVPAAGTPTLTIHRGVRSFLDLPVVPIVRPNGGG